MINGTVLVTGAAGFIGSQVCWALHDRGVRVLAVDTNGDCTRLPRDTEWVWGQVCHIRGDANLGAMGFDWVVHLAAFTSAPESMKLPLWYWDNNVTQMTALVENCVRHKARGIVFASSSAVYDDQAREPGVGIREDDPIRPLTPYGSTKLAGEELVRISGIPHVVLRLFNVAGADSKGRTGLVRQNGSLVKTACRAALTGQKFTVNGHEWDAGDGTPERDLVHVEDVAEAIIRSLLHLQMGRGPVILNVGTGESVTVLDVVREVHRQVFRGGDHLGFGSEELKWVTTGPPREGDVAFSQADTGRLRRELGWQPKADLARIVRDSLAWERKLIEEGR